MDIYSLLLTKTRIIIGFDTTLPLNEKSLKSAKGGRIFNNFKTYEFQKFYLR